MNITLFLLQASGREGLLVYNIYFLLANLLLQESLLDSNH